MCADISSIYDASSSPPLFFLKTKTKNILVSLCRYGAYLSHSWSNRTLRYFGNGETFIFQCQPSFEAFKWDDDAGAGSSGGPPAAAGTGGATTVGSVVESTEGDATSANTADSSDGSGGGGGDGGGDRDRGFFMIGNPDRIGVGAYKRCVCH